MQFKHDKDKEIFLTLHPILIMIYADLYWYAKSVHDIELVITQTVSTPEQDAQLKRVSKAHQRGLAIDIRTRDIDAFIVDDLKEYINNKDEYETYKYLSRSGKKRLAYWHIGSAQHFHLAIHSRFSKVNTLQ